MKNFTKTQQFGKNTIHTAISIGVLFVILIAGFFVISSYIDTEEQQPEPASTQTYTNEAHGFSFEYPADWHEGDNNSADLFQLYNYDVSSVTGGHSWGEDQNKIEGVIVPDDTYGSSSDFPEESREETQVTVDGRDAMQYDVVLQGSTHIRSYVIPLHNEANEYVLISMYGDDAENFDVIDHAMDTLTFDEQVTRTEGEFEWDETAIRDKNGNTIIAADDVPGSIAVSEDSEFGVAGRITSAALSPDGKTVAFTMSGAAHGAGWLFDVNTDALTPVVFQYGGGVEVIEWNADSTAIALSVSTPAGTNLLKIVPRDDSGEFPSDIGFQVEVPAEEDLDPPYSYTFSQWRSTEVVCFTFEEEDKCININTQELAE